MLEGLYGDGDVITGTWSRLRGVSIEVNGRQYALVLMTRGTNQAAVEKYRRLEAEDEPTGTWIRPPDADVIHHSVSFDGYEHGTACGRTFTEAPFNVFMDPAEIPDGWPVCGGCLEDD